MANVLKVEKFQGPRACESDLANLTSRFWGTGAVQ